MNTKIVYVVVSQENDIYVEQAYMSIWSCRYYNPTACITVVTDKNTESIIDSYTGLKKLISELITIEVPVGISNFEKSRVLKTRLRSLITGNFLFIDTDTIICESISEVDDINDDVAIVEDLHAISLITHPFEKSIALKYNKLYGVSPTPKSIYYNSGVIFCKDSLKGHDFYNRWHQNWLITKDKLGGLFDQPSLLKTVIENPDMVKPLNPIYNVQVLGCIRYLHSGKIIHFFNANWGRDSVHPFLDKKYYYQIREDRNLSEIVKQDILECKSLFGIPTFIIGPDDVPYWISIPTRILKKVQNYHYLSKIVNLSLRIINKTFKL